MPLNPRTIATVTRWAVTYAPHAKKLAETAGPAIKDRANQSQARRRALTHASTLLDGSILRAVDPVTTTLLWVVYSGDEPVATHPSTTTTLDKIVERSDLSKRIYPSEQPDRLKTVVERAKKRRPGRSQ